MLRRLPSRIWNWLTLQRRLATEDSPLPVSIFKYAPYRPGAKVYSLPKAPAPGGAVCEFGLPIPPQPLWLGYGKTPEEYLHSGQVHTRIMLRTLAKGGFTLAPGARVLELGCAAGRMLRHLHPHAASGELWGVDISAECIYWCKQYLSPPFHFATTTTLPHVPFEDRTFDLIYCGSVFTHIDELADAWLLELRRLLAPQGRIYATIHDHHTADILEGPMRNAMLAKALRRGAVTREQIQGSALLVMGRGPASQVFYDADSFRRNAEGMFTVVTVRPEAYSHQTAFVLARK